MTAKTITYYTLTSYRESLGRSADLNFVSRELANEHIIKELTPKNWTPNVELSNLTITKKERVWVDREHTIYYKNDPKRIKKVEKKSVQGDKFNGIDDVLKK